MESNSHETEEKWQCPAECPYQSDDSAWLRIWRRYRTFFWVSLVTGMMWTWVTLSDERSITREEMIYSSILIGLSLVRPSAIDQLIIIGLKAIDKALKD